METKVVVITGASSGIGEALAKQLGRQGHSLILGARREAELKRVARECNSKALSVACDVTRRTDMENLRNAAIKEFGHVDVWVNNAGRGINQKVLDLTDEGFDEMINVNLRSALYGMQAIIPHFKDRRKGHLINTSTFLSKVPFVTFRSMYSASKAALNSLTTNLRMDLKAEYPEIHISLVMPGVVTNNFAQNAMGGTPPIAAVSGFMTSQTSDEAAEAIVKLIENPQPEVFTNPALIEISRKFCLGERQL
jgi:NADP-dependent 3-hydroxy acid dehydrogenase YdfG